MKMFLTFFIMFVLSIIAHGNNVPSGHEVGNGGSFVVCGPESPTGPGVFSLDRHEAEFQHSLQPASFLANFSDSVQIVEIVLQELTRYDAVRGRFYQNLLAQILTHREFLSVPVLSPIADSGLTTVIEGCKLTQAAVFFANSDLGTLRFMYDQKLWNKASSLDQAYLILHEIIYIEAKEIQKPSHINSMGARYMTAFLMAKVGLLDAHELEQTFRSAGFNKL